MRIAAIDIGTNSVHMIIVQVKPDLSFEVIDREKEMVRLGAGGLDGRALTDTAMAAALQTLSKFKKLADSYQVDEIVGAATSAVREAENGGDFLAEVARQTGIRARVISGTEEARLIHLAAGYGVDVGSSSAVVVDIGGGSVEITLGPATSVQLARSFKIGVIRLTERFVRSDPLAKRDEQRLVKYVNRQIGGHVAEIAARGFDRVIGTSGTILSLGALAAQDKARRSDDLRNLRVSAKQLHRVRKEIVTLTLEERLRMPGLDPRRADLSVAGAVLLDTILRRLGADELTLCDLALREGLILDYIHTNSTRIAQVDRYPDVRRRSVIELGQRCNYWSAHAQHVARLALSLFDQTRSLHGLTDTEREWLEYGALLHDVGVHISYDRHHKHSEYLIRNGDLRGFEPAEIEAIALIARYHRQSIPKKSHSEFRKLRAPLRRSIRVLAALVRLAEGLDRSHAQMVSTLQLQNRGDDYLIRLQSSGDAELELWSAHRHVAPLEKLFGKVIRFEIAEKLYAEQPDNGARVSGKALRGRGDRRVRQDHAALADARVADRGRTSRVRHRMELVGAGKGRHQERQETEQPHADDVQPPARHRLR
jgi:exopolyphosphatase/guanosine-5'-triphosphate,3'-diphosphate pyrophosphatase